MKIFKTCAALLLALSIGAAPALASEESDELFIKQETLRERLALRETEAEDEETLLWTEDPDGSVLTAWGGVNYYFDQKETYYNLDMSGVVAIAHAQGIEGDYWVRDDGCKMLGDYIMIAANRDVHPQGSIVATSLGLGIVVDTGAFAYSDPTQVDIAVNW